MPDSSLTGPAVTRGERDESRTGESPATAGRNGPRVLMLCDDLQIDRRIILEAQTLIEVGCEVIVLGRSGPGQPQYAIEGGVKIERIDYYEFAARRQVRQSVRGGFAAIKVDAGEEGEPQARRAGKIRAPIQVFGPPRLEQWIAHRRRPLRAAARALLWPPYRLEILRRVAPSLPPAAQYSIYLPSLLVTPRPAALRWHWRRIRWRLSQRGAERRAQQHESDAEPGPEAPAGTAVPPEIQQAAGPDENLNDWELALIDRGIFFRPDIVHAHDLPQLRAGWVIGRVLGIPVIYDAHEMYPEIGTLSRDDSRKCKDIETRLIGRVDHVITVNPFIAERQAATYAIARPDVILNATVLPPGFVRGTRTDELRSATGLALDQKILLFQGWVSLDRSLGDLVQAMSEVPANIHLAILGFGDDIPKLLRIARTAGVGGRVHVLDPVPQEVLIHWVASADAGIIPYQARDENYRYCSPNKLFEFIAACTPIVANDLPYLRHVVAGEGYGVVRAFGGAAGCAEAIRAMFDATLGGPDRFRPPLLATGERYLWPRQVPTLLEIYRKVSGWPEAAVVAHPPVRPDRA